MTEFVQGAAPAFRLQDGDLLLELDKCALHPVHKVPTQYFRMVRAQSGEELGVVNLRVASNAHIERYAGHVGYAVHEGHRGHHYAARALRLLIPVARENGLETLWITCDPENMASRRTCELAGARFVEIVDVPESCVIYQGGHPKKCQYRLEVGRES